MPDEILEQLNLNALVVRDARGTNVVRLARDGEGNSTAIPGLTDAIAAASPLLTPDAQGRVIGLLPSPLGTMVVAARPIRMSDGSGTPRGTVVMARLFDESYTQRLAEMLAVGVRAFPLDSPELEQSVRDKLAAGGADYTTTGPAPDNRIAGYSYLTDLSGKPVMILCVDVDRRIEAQIGRTLSASLVTVGLTGIVLVGTLVFVIQVTVVGRLRYLLDEMNNITGRGSSEGLRTHVTGSDEIGEVASGVNAMLDRLEAAAADRIRLEEAVTAQERLAEEAFRELDEGLLVVDDAGTCTASNLAALRLLNLSSDQVVGQPIATVLPVLRPADDVARSAGDQFFEIGGRAVAVSRSSAVTPGRLSVIALRDFTDARSVERLKRDLVATVSHELRTPLTAIQATVSMLSAGDGGDLTDTQQRLVALLDRNTERLRVLIDDLLHMGALEGGRVTLKRMSVNLADTCATVVSDCTASAAAKNVTLRTDLNDARVSADSTRIQQVIENLLQNAVKFTPSGGWIDVSTHLWNQRATVVVRDTGIGIATEDLDRVFEKFYRTPDGARFAHGTGLGLSIARSIVALHGGRLTAESDGRNGTTMTVELPVGTPSEEE